MAASMKVLMNLKGSLSSCGGNMLASMSRQIAPTSMMLLNIEKCAIVRCLSTTMLKSLKEIQCTVDGNVTTIEGVHVESERKGLVVEVEDENQSCNLCRLNLNLKYTDVLILSQFLKMDGGILPRKVTGLCMKQHKKIIQLVHQAQRAGLMPTLRPPGRDGKPKPHMKSNYKWKQYNCYFD